jgi:hypothetical protein
MRGSNKCSIDSEKRKKDEKKVGKFFGGGAMLWCQ